MIQRQGKRKKDWETMLGLLTNLRDQYIIDRYLKKDENKPEKYKKNTIFKTIQKTFQKPEGMTSEKYKKELKKSLKNYLEDELQDFKEIVELKLFGKDNLAKYYAIRGDKAPTELDQDFEKILYKNSEKPSKKQISKPSSSKVSYKPIAKKSKVNLENKEEMKKYFDKLEKKESKISKSQKNNELVELGYLLNDLSLERKDVLSKMTKLYDNYKNQLEKSKQKEEIVSKREIPMWKKEMDAKNYKNEIYKRNEALKDARYKNKYNIYSLEKDMSNIVISPKRKRSKNLENLKQRLAAIKKEEDEMKKRKMIKLIDIPTVTRSPKFKQGKKRRRSSSSTASLDDFISLLSSSSSSRKSLSTPTSSKSGDSIENYF